MKVKTSIGVTASLLLLAASAGAATWTGTDVGTPALPGSVTGTPTGTLTIVGGGDDIWNNSDNFYYYYTSQTGLVWEAVVKVEDLQGPDNWTKAELMVRVPQTLGGAPSGPDRHLSNMTTRSGGQNAIGGQYRAARSGGSGEANPNPVLRPAYPNTWLKIRREGAVFTLSYGNDGTTWTNYWTTDTRSAPLNGAFPDPVLVGLAVTAHNDGDPGGATARFSNLALTSLPLPQPPTLLNPQTQIQDATVYSMSPVTFSFVATNNARPDVPVLYSWYKNNQLLTNITGTSYTFQATAADNGAKVYAVATMAPWNNPNNLSLNSSTGTLTVLPGTYFTNGVKVETYAGASRVNVQNGNVAAPSSINLNSSFDFADDGAQNYARRVSGWFLPKVTGAYHFYVAADDDTDVFLSTNADPANKRLIAQEQGWSGYRNYETQGDANADASLRSSATWHDAEWQTPYYEGINLTAGNLYYIEAVHRQGGGGGNLSVTYAMADQTGPTNGAPTLLHATNSNLVLMTGPTTTLNWAAQPTNTSVYDGLKATLYARAVSDNELALNYQWYRDGQPIAGATASSYQLTANSATENNAKFHVTAATPLGGLSITSPVVNLTVLQSVFEKGYVMAEFWPGATRATINSGAAGAPSMVYAAPSWEKGVPGNADGDNYGFRFTGFFIPPATTAYTFFVNSDDSTDLYISTDHLAANKRMVAQETSWSNPLQWVGGNSTVSQKRSDQWVPSGGSSSPFASGISMTANQRYYMEAVLQEGTGGDNLQVTYKRHSDPDPINGDRSKLTGDVIGINAVRCSYVAFTTQPANVSVPAMDSALFTAAGITDSTMPVGGTDTASTNNFLIYQWYKNGVAIPGATSASYRTPPLLPSESGAQYMVKARALGYADNALNPIWTNSTTATVTILPSVFEPGLVKSELWNGATRAAVNAGTVGAPAWTTYVQQWDQGSGIADNYTRKFSGFFIPPASDKYAFYINADDDSDLFLSTDASPANKRLIAQETQWGSDLLNWTTTSGNQSQRASFTFSADGGNTTPFQEGFQLQANTRYYMEAVQRDGGGGDYLQVLYVPIGQAWDVTNNQPVNMTGAVIGTYVPQATYVAFTQQPQNVTAESLQPAVFSAAGTSDSSVSLSPNGPPTLNNKPAMMYQWYKNGVAIPGATQPTLRLAEVLPADNGAQFTVAMRALGYGDSSGNILWSNSQPATLAVQMTPPTVTAARSHVDLNANPQVSYVDIGFSKRMDPATLANIGNYTVPAGLTITSVSVSPDARSVKLTLSGTPAAGSTVTVKAGSDAVGTALAANTTATIQPLPLTFRDIGNTGDPAFPSVLYVQGPRDFLVQAQGSDIWGQADGFNFLYEQKTGDFDVVVRQKGISHSSQWAKGGLMVREDLTPGSRNWNIVNTPQASDGIMAPDASGYGSSAIEANARMTAGGDSAGWDFARGYRSPYPNAWLRMKRTGQTLSAYYSDNGQSWTLAATNTPATPLPASLYVGMATTAHNNDPVGTPPELQVYWNTVPYADYNSNYTAPVGNPQITYSISGSQMTINWSPAVGTLQQSPSLSGGAWTTVPSTGGSATVNIGTGSMFFRVQVQ